MGFWRSFRVGLVAVPVLVGMVAIIAGELAPGTDPVTVGFAEVLSFGFNWFGFRC